MPDPDVDALVLRFRLATPARWHRSACPKCAAAKPRRRDTALAVRIEGGRLGWLCHRCGWRGAVALDGPVADRPLRRRPEHPAGREPPEPTPEETGRIARARRIWRSARPIRPGDAADRYLCRRLDGWRPPSGWPPTLRLGRWRHGPALVAAACPWPARRVVAVQLTRLAQDGRRAAVAPTRLTFGLLRGAAVRLSSWAPGRPVVLVEGIEDGLAVLAATAAGATPPAVWANLGASNAPSLALPPEAEVILALDGDPAGRRAAAKAALRLQAEGHAVRIARLPDGLDPNAALLRCGHGAGLHPAPCGSITDAEIGHES